MRATYLAFRLLAAGCVFSSSLSSCAEGGLSEAELNGDDTEDVVSRDGGRTPVKDAGKDGRASSGGSTDTDDDDDAPSGGSTGGKRDAGTGTGTGTGSGTKTDAGTGTSTGGLGAAIKCPTSMACNTSLAAILSFLDPTITATTNLCVLTGSVLPSAPSCTTDTECKSARLTTAKCSAGSCIQPCTP
jgi:hypothetical protein